MSDSTEFRLVELAKRISIGAYTALALSVFFLWMNLSVLNETVPVLMALGKASQMWDAEVKEWRKNELETFEKQENRISYLLKTSLENFKRTLASDDRCRIAIRNRLKILEEVLMGQ